METQTLTNVIVRPAVPDDLGALAEFIKPFVAEGRLLPRTFNELADFLPSFFVAELDGRLIGCAALEVYSWKLAEVRSLAVAPEARGLGIGRLLVNACVNRAREQRILEVMAITSSEDFFKSCGFDFTLPGEKKALFIQTRDEI
jgi:N-acetylglutamate synthase-like GNAT family acetyltransferase